MTKNLNDNLQEEINNADYRPYASNSLKKECFAFVVEGAGDRSYHFYYHRLNNRSIQRFKDFDSGKDVMTFELFAPEQRLCLFLINFDRKYYLKFEEDFLNRNVQRIFEYSGDVEKASKPVIMVKDLDERHSSRDDAPEAFSSVIASHS